MLFSTGSVVDAAPTDVVAIPDDSSVAEVSIGNVLEYRALE